MMKILTFSLMTFLFVMCGHRSFAQDGDIINTTFSPYNKFQKTSIGDVTWTKGFWKDRFDQAYKVTIPHLYKYFNGKSNDIGISGLGSNNILNNFRIAAGEKKGEFSGSKWGDGDFYKWLEGVADVYAVTKDKSLDSLMDVIINLIGKAQQDDGYINTQMTIPGNPRFTNFNDHETYNMGHLIIASCVHYKATGKTTFLEIGKKAADCLYDAFIDPSVHFVGYTSIMALTELYRVTAEKKYLDLALEFVNKHGKEGEVKLNDGSTGTERAQDRTPIREESIAVGHAVWGTYLYSGVSDVYAEIGEKELFEAMDRIWQDLHEKKFYITGGVSAAHHIVTPKGDKAVEAFGHPYDLPNATASNESCSSIGNAMWNLRMLRLTGDSKYADIIETTLYNIFLAGMGLEGKTFFYTNPLERYGAEGVFDEDDTMMRWIHRGGFCCPPNVLRTIVSINNWAYNISEKGVYVNLYGSNILQTKLLDGSEIKVTQETDYPWNGNIKLGIEVPEQKAFSMMLRIPEWAAGAKIYVNGKRQENSITEGTYAEVYRSWTSGDIIHLELPMNVEVIQNNPLVKENLNKVAIKRGPVVYCLESADFIDGTRVEDIIIPSGIKLKPIHKEHLLGGVTTLEGMALKKVSENPTNGNGGTHYSLKKASVKLIPYYAWANRGISYMKVWLPEE